MKNRKKAVIALCADNAKKAKAAADNEPAKTAANGNDPHPAGIIEKIQNSGAWILWHYGRCA
jgi:hypothetical protein